MSGYQSLTKRHQRSLIQRKLHNDLTEKLDDPRVLYYILESCIQDIKIFPNKLWKSQSKQFKEITQNDIIDLSLIQTVLKEIPEYVR